jgi:hypothetical protein
MSLRRPLLMLTPEDARLIRQRLKTNVGDIAHPVERYLALAGAASGGATSPTGTSDIVLEG